MSELNLYLLRHAKTLEREGNQLDFDRELHPIGLQNATRMGIFLKDSTPNFDFIISSPAVRAKKTIELIAEQIKIDTNSIHYNDDIYEASVRNLLQTINSFKSNWKTVMLVGHNPALSYLAEYLTGEAIGSLTTCGLVHLKFKNVDWNMVTEKSGYFVSYYFPESLNF